MINVLRNDCFLLDYLLFLSKIYNTVSENIETEKIILMIKNELSRIAGKDGKVTEDEQALINSILEEANKYKTILDKAISNNKIDQQERIRLFQGKLNMVQKAVSKIRDDLIVSDDEQAIINGLQLLLPKISDFEAKFIDE